VEIEVSGERILIGTDKFIYLPDHQYLVISDLHIGKIAHFRKNGIALPMNSEHVDLQRIEILLNSFEVKRCLFLGDLFHSEMNNFWYEFVEKIGKYADIDFTLIKGNHDILQTKAYHDATIEVVNELLVGQILFSHEKIENSLYYNIYGHVHPGVLIKGKARQTLRLPCYYFSESEGILPAFGTFTGLHIIEPSKGDHVFVIGNKTIIKVSS
jgi:uncharacterized protein